MQGSDQVEEKQSARFASEFLYQILKPVIRILIRTGYSARNAIDLIRWAYVRVFYDTPQFCRQNEPTAIQCALKTGISRSEVSQLLAVESPRETDRIDKRNRAARVLWAWTHDPEFDRDGRPAILPLTSRSTPSFCSLVNKHETDARYQNVLDDLLAVGCVRTDANTVELVNPTYGFNAVRPEKLAFAGDMAGHLLKTAEANVSSENPDDRILQRIWWQRNIPASRVKDAQAMVRRLGELHGRHMDRALTAFADQTPVPGEKYVQVGVGIYGFEVCEDGTTEE